MLEGYKRPWIYVAFLAIWPNEHIQNGCQTCSHLQLSKEYFNFNQTFRDDSCGHFESFQLSESRSHDLAAILDFFWKCHFWSLWGAVYWEAATKHCLWLHVPLEDCMPLEHSFLPLECFNQPILSCGQHLVLFEKFVHGFLVGPKFGFSFGILGKCSK